MTNPFRRRPATPTPADRLRSYEGREDEVARYHEYIRRMNTTQRQQMREEATENDRTWAGQTR